MKENPYSLSAADIAHFDAAVASDRAVLQMIDGAAAEWREKIRPKFRSAEACRRALLLRSVLLSAKLAVGRDWRITDLPELSRYLCQCVEMRVAKLDADEEKHDGGEKGALTNPAFSE